jgi:hypothetical protein
MTWWLGFIVGIFAFCAIMAGVDTWKNRHRIPEAGKELEEEAKKVYDNMYG